ncbi:hypothetical protein COV18_04240 [Candidatus Woesearchaeota archaeon CG10_big_fil_rev_8_21_14_0_10_37_12]|nr:MAG: hypothetical protein COV18_04240 [Candidatus Woesearchaeota archaeon CG10_big_fil_rev_8_21_14_0_10_37_12]
MMQEASLPPRLRHLFVFIVLGFLLAIALIAIAGGIPGGGILNDPLAQIFLIVVLVLGLVGYVILRPE